MKAQKLFTRSALATLATVLLAASAHAAVYTATYTGTVTSGDDTFGDFGTVGADLTGLTYTSVFEYDLSLGTMENRIHPTYSVLEDVGGVSLNTTSPVLGSSVTIGGVLVSLDGIAEYGDEVTGNGPGPLNVFKSDYFATQTAARTQSLANSLFNLSIPLSFTQTYSLDALGPYDNYLGYYLDERGDDSTGYVDEMISLGEGHLTITSGAPEPAAWGLMLVGFAGLGAKLRRNRARRPALLS